jgi:hypothetical protein
VVLFRFRKDGSRYICYSPSDKRLNYYEDKTLVYSDDSVFLSLLGQWCFISITSLNPYANDPSDISLYFQKLQKFYVQDKEIKRVSAAPPVGGTFNALDIGYEYSALLADIRVYRNFILNPYAYVTSPSRKFDELLYKYDLATQSENGVCVTDNMLDSLSYADIPRENNSVSLVKRLGLGCELDVHQYLLSGCSTGFLDYSEINTKGLKCTSCDYSCAENCSNSGKYDCMCDMASAKRFLRYDTAADKHYCDTRPYFDFSNKKDINIQNVKAPNNGEYAIEFWVYLYSYNSTNVAFESEEIIWDNYSYMKIFYSQNSLGVICNPVYQDSSALQYKGFENQDILNKGLMTWVQVSCATNIPLKKYNLNKKIFDLDLLTDPGLMIDNSSRSSTNLLIRSGANSRTNYGFLFIKELKLWSIYDNNVFSSECL